MKKGKGRIDYDDDLVVVYDGKGKVIYKGIEDYEPMKDMPWCWDNAISGYRYEKYVKILVG